MKKLKSVLFKEIPRKIIWVFFAFVFSGFLINIAVAAWENPTCGPTGCNVDQPINVSDYFQEKEGGLGLRSPLEMNSENINDGGEIHADRFLADSDERLKHELRRIDNPLGKLSEMSGYYFYWNEQGKEERDLGVSAQEVEVVLPEIVSEKQDGYKAVDYSKLTPLLIEALKEQQAELEKLQERVRNLEEKLE